jgi:hypothetical protein
MRQLEHSLGTKFKIILAVVDHVHPFQGDPARLPIQSITIIYLCIFLSKTTEEQGTYFDCHLKKCMAWT